MTIISDSPTLIHQNVRMMQDIGTLLSRYDRPLPRYTSYPPVPSWKGLPTEKEWRLKVEANYNPKEGIDLYVHIPFCQELCYYCGCQRVINKNKNRQESYVEALLLEWEYICRHFFHDHPPKIQSIHFGGGTPNFLHPQNFERLCHHFFMGGKASNFHGAVELDPRTVQLEHLYTLLDLGITRLSFGIQDFDPRVQEAINRHQSVELVQGWVNKIRAMNVDSINFDLIYGLPRQTIQSVQTTLEHVLRMRPDHYILPDSPLDLAAQNGTLARSFMGHSEKKSSLLIGLGASAISSSPNAFVQNFRSTPDYEKKSMEGALTGNHGHLKSEQEVLNDRRIQSIMGCGKWTLSNQEFQELSLINKWQEQCDQMEKDGLIKKNTVDTNQTSFPLGSEERHFLRNIAALFDPSLYDRRSANQGRAKGL